MTNSTFATQTTEWQMLPAGFSVAEPLYVFTDIHGCFEAMERLLSKRPKDTRLVFLGDAVDRGPQPMEVLKVLMADKQNILLRGNHDAMAWYSQPDVYPTYSWAFQDWRANGGMITRDAFRDALKHGAQPGEIASTVPMIFEDYWHFANNWWRSGNFLFVHAGLPDGKGRKWLGMPPLEAAMHMSSPYWWRPRDETDLYMEPREVDGENFFVVSGHTPLPEFFALCPYGITLDRSYKHKMAAEIRPAGNGQPATVRFITTKCNGYRKEVSSMETRSVRRAQ